VDLMPLNKNGSIVDLSSNSGPCNEYVNPDFEEVKTNPKVLE
jgi:hypothetical protein